MSNYLTIAELAEQADIPNSTCRRYLSTFEAFFLVKGGSRLKKYEQRAVDILKRIKHLYDDGLESNEIHSVLVGEFPLVIDGDEQRESDESPVVSALATSEDVKEIKQALEDQKVFNQQLLEQIKQQQEYIKQSLDRRDQELLKAIRESQQAQLEVAASEKEEPKKGFFARWFKIKV